ncbi:MAG: hypothetical protein AAB414_00310 [Patescibacteria group bacterium]
MTYLLFAIISYFLNSVAVTVDKFLLTKTIPDPLIYIFYFSLISLFALFAIPFVHTPSLEVFFLASISTLAWTFGAYLMFWALKSDQVQRVIPVIGTITPLVLLIFASQARSITNHQTVAITLLILGIIFLTLQDLKGKLIKEEIILEVCSAVFFAISYYMLRLAFEKESFLTVLVWSRPILLPLGILFLIIPFLRKKIKFILHSPKQIVQKGGPIFLLGQLSAGASELLLTFSISLANPAIVNSLQGIKYVFLLTFSLILGKKYPQIFKNKFSPVFLTSQILGIGFIGVGLYLLLI